MKLPQFLRSESGATAVEYGLLVALIALAVFVAVELAGDNLAAAFTAASDGLVER